MSAVEWVPPTPEPRTMTGSTMVVIVESTVSVVPCTVRLPWITTLSLMFTCPPVESNVKFPDEVSTVLAEFPILTEFAVTLPVPTDNAFVEGLYWSSASDDNATPEPVAFNENTIEWLDAFPPAARLIFCAVVAVEELPTNVPKKLVAVAAVPVKFPENTVADKTLVLGL